MARTRGVDVVRDHAAGTRRLTAPRGRGGSLLPSSLMPLPRIAIVGRPNVGKSSLLNMIARHRVAIVDPTPGVTRDRISVIVDLQPPTDRRDGLPARKVEIIDTGGYGIYSGEEDDADSKALIGDVEFQIGQAIAKADFIFFVLDAQSGLTPLDRTVAELLRRQGASDRVRLIANKVDAESWEVHAAEAAALGFGPAMPVSALNGYNRRRFFEMLYDLVPMAPEEREPEMKVAIVGKRNAGKSTLINALAGERRVIVSEIPGTTRDSVDVRFEIDGRAFTAIDTAGVRKGKSLQSDVEYYSQHRALRSIRRADVVALLIDATVPVSQVDKQLTQEIQTHYKPCVIVVNKWDLTAGKTNRKGEPITPEDYLDYLTKELGGLDYAPCVFISAATGEGVRDAAAMAFNLFQQAGHRETTGSLNAAFQRILEARGPSSRLGRQARIFYVSQIAVHPPTIVLVVNRTELFDGQYERYLLNRLREELPFSEVPIRLIFRDRKRKALHDLKHGPRRGELPSVEAAEGNDAFDELEEIEGEVPDRFQDEDTPGAVA
ncbi:MAG: ribosome biogenesis GTPase Der [Phycisphaerales bacterium]|nr:ribosome biogenesis GTPase Der [Phycisphaerales bacterium]